MTGNRFKPVVVSWQIYGGNIGAATHTFYQRFCLLFCCLMGSLGNFHFPKTPWTADQDEGISNIYFVFYSDNTHETHSSLLTIPILKHFTF